jgi:hypothetical protein
MVSRQNLWWLLVPAIALPAMLGLVRIEAHEHGCVNPQDVRILDDGETKELRVGEVFRVALGEGAAATQAGMPTEFPWQAPRSPNSNVLEIVDPCGGTSARPSTLAQLTLVFRAKAAGSAEVTAPLTPAWASFTGTIHLTAYRSTIVVRDCWARLPNVCIG